MKKLGFFFFFIICGLRIVYRYFLILFNYFLFTLFHFNQTKNLLIRFNNVRTALVMLFVIAAISFSFAGVDPDLQGSSCKDYCKNDDFRTCSIAAYDSDGYPITVVCHYMTKKFN